MKKIIVSIPLIILVSFMLYTIIYCINTMVVLNKEHYTGLILLALICGIYFFNYKIALALTIIPILLGVFDFAAYMPSVHYFRFSMPKISSFRITIQPFSLYILISYFLFGSYKVLIEVIESYTKKK